MATAAGVFNAASEEARRNAAIRAAALREISNAADAAAAILLPSPQQRLQQHPQGNMQAAQQGSQWAEGDQRHLPSQQCLEPEGLQQQDTASDRNKEIEASGGQQHVQPPGDACIAPDITDSAAGAAPETDPQKAATVLAATPPAPQGALAGGARVLEAEGKARDEGAPEASAVTAGPSAEAGTHIAAGALVAPAMGEGTTDTDVVKTEAPATAATLSVKTEKSKETASHRGAVEENARELAGGHLTRKEDRAAASSSGGASGSALGCGERADIKEDTDEENELSEKKANDEDEERGPSRLKFPTYEEFLKEEEAEQQKEKAEGEKEAEAGVQSSSSAEVDAAFELFMSEVKDMPTASSSKIGREKGGTLAGRQQRKNAALPTFKTPDEECVRLTAQVFPSPFQVLLLGADATEDEIRKQYRKLSCYDAVVNKAYEQLQHPEMREKYREVIEEAKRRVIKERVKENKKRKTQGRGGTLLSEDPADCQQEITDMCEKLLQETRERREYAERTRQANERYEQEQQEKLAKEELDKCKERKAFLDQREERVEGWRQYQQAIHAKDVKLQAFTGVRHQREQRKEDDLIRKRQKMQGVDVSYKDSWR